jgi:hypothetical protein
VKDNKEMKVKTRLIASAPNEEGIKNMIAKFFCGKPENYRIGDTGLLWRKNPDGTERWLKSFRVIQKKRPYPF